MGVSGGYQAARAGPSMCPGGDYESLDMVIPLLKKVAVRDAVDSLQLVKSVQEVLVIM